jgi:predicted DNA-binding protein (MmcQ/YjbR family)
MTKPQKPSKSSKAKAAPLARIRRLCLALPETTEKVAWGAPTFRVRGKLFVMFADNHHGDGRLAIWCNAAAGSQAALVASDPDNFFVPPYMGKAGWVGVRLDQGLDLSIIAELVADAHRATDPELDG